ncbi:uncharacterized protein FOMMEDRAFT_168777 [Fomitiporia mediterranea MF3/22]|uniref:uncharacterized protein n=1 Tax=Fomitiporia mediterranea (strain MF3/22) TaxID=694068 RepID=UPI000440822D|nr:uncharacterized protein FOMMEDRAFT_168777 [Fomitiporia mediterranea MF3/22]EJD02279.1 hypothetical protein FOMMEDRAFT_168777 [Fomitiporia mediterranea MF3/22]
MHFCKTYSQLLLTLPQELQENAIEYRQLKKLINKVVNELTSLGLSPAVLQNILQKNDTASGSAKGKQRAFGERPEEIVNVGDQDDGVADLSRPQTTKAIYEVIHDGEHLQPRLRVWVGRQKDTDSGNRAGDNVDDSPRSPASAARVTILLDAPESLSSSPVDAVASSQEINSDYVGNRELLLVAKPIVARPRQSLIWTLQKQAEIEETEEAATPELPSTEGQESNVPIPVVHPVELVRRQVLVTADGTRELIIPLESDMAFFELLYTALQSLSSRLLVVRSDFIGKLDALARTISRTARPQSASSRGFHPSSSLGDAEAISAPLISPFSSSFVPGGKVKSDLYTWREIFQLYVEAEIFESVHEQDRGERSIAETERRLAFFAEQVTTRGLSDRRKLKYKESRDALESFLQLNVFLVNLKKFQFATAEAARKILKKHAKRTALPFPIPSLDGSSASLQGDKQVSSLLRRDGPGVLYADILTLIPTSTLSLPHILVQAIGETLLPIIPHLDDYSCLICVNIAFKPIRLSCGHLFCVRCLVKMQKRGQDHCPCCRAPTVLKANRTNVDWAMLNFMQDWFPRETAKKLKQNEKEAAQEQLEELGIPDQSCVVM